MRLDELPWGLPYDVMSEEGTARYAELGNLCFCWYVHRNAYWLGDRTKPREDGFFYLYCELDPIAAQAVLFDLLQT